MTALTELTTLDEVVLGDPGRAVNDLPPHPRARARATCRRTRPSSGSTPRARAGPSSTAVLASELAWAPPGEHVALRYRRAELHARAPRRSRRRGRAARRGRLGAAEPRRRSRAARGAARSSPSLQQRVARILEPLYVRDQAVERPVRRAADPARGRGRRRGRAAARSHRRHVEERELELGPRRVRDLGPGPGGRPGRARAPEAILRLAATYDRWHDAAAAFDAAATASAGDLAVAVPLRQHVAEICDRSLGDNPRAIAAYQALIALDPATSSASTPALAALARLHEEEEQWRRCARWWRGRPRLGGRGAAWRFLARAAELDEQRLGDPDRAIASWRDVLAEAIRPRGALANLERLYQARDRWRDLAELLRHKIDRADEPATKIGRAAPPGRGPRGDAGRAGRGHRRPPRGARSRRRRRRRARRAGPALPRGQPARSISSTSSSAGSRWPTPRRRRSGERAAPSWRRSSAKLAAAERRPRALGRGPGTVEPEHAGGAGRGAGRLRRSRAGAARRRRSSSRCTRRPATIASWRRCWRPRRRARGRAPRERARLWMRGSRDPRASAGRSQPAAFAAAVAALHASVAEPELPERSRRSIAWPAI
jgi:tetratricopeptide (TPR) repeat protein